MPSAPVPGQAVRVTGLRELTRAFAVANREFGRDLRTAIEQAGEPIRQEASSLAHTRISGMARSRVPWWTMRAGVTRGTIGYIVPQQRGNMSRTRFTPRGRADAFKREMMEKALQPALDANRHRVFEEFDDALTETLKAWARV